MMDIGLVRGLIAVITLLVFLGICWWAYRPANRARFEEDAWLAFADEDKRPPAKERKDGASKDRDASEGEGAV